MNVSNKGNIGLNKAVQIAAGTAGSLDSEQYEKLVDKIKSRYGDNEDIQNALLTYVEASEGDAVKDLASKIEETLEVAEYEDNIINSFVKSEPSIRSELNTTPTHMFNRVTSGVTRITSSGTSSYPSIGGTIPIQPYDISIKMEAMECIDNLPEEDLKTITLKYKLGQPD